MGENGKDGEVLRGNGRVKDDEKKRLKEKRLW